MDKISSFTLTNNGSFLAKIHIKATRPSGGSATFTSGSFSKHNTKTVYLKDCKNIKDGDIVLLVAQVVGGKERTATECFVFDRTANRNAKYSVKGSSLITKNSLKFEGLEALGSSGSNTGSNTGTNTVPTDPVEKALYNFEKSSVAGCWSKISKKDVVNGIRHILWGTESAKNGINTVFDVVMKNPSVESCRDNLEQGNYPICGATAIMYDFVHKNPEKFVKCMQDLYEKGSFEAVKGEKITASAKLRDYAVNYEKYKNKDKNSSCVCWMLQATICQNMNKVFKDINPNFPDGRVTMSALRTGIKKMCSDLLGYKNVEFLASDRANYIKNTLKTAWTKALRKNGTVFMLYSADDLEKNTRKFNASNWHWVPCYDFTFKGDNLSIVYHSWGVLRRIKSISIDEFSIYYSSCVIAY